MARNGKEGCLSQVHHKTSNFSTHLLGYRPLRVDGAGDLSAETVLMKAWIMQTRRLTQWLRSFGRSENGTATLEAILWTPFFLILFGLVTDTSIVFGRQAEIMRIVQDSNRSLAVGAFQTVQQAEDYITGKIESFSSNTTVDVVIDRGIISTSVTLPAVDLTSTGLFGAFDSLTITIGASQMSELG